MPAAAVGSKCRRGALRSRYAHRAGEDHGPVPATTLSKPAQTDSPSTTSAETIQSPRATRRAMSMSLTVAPTCRPQRRCRCRSAVRKLPGTNDRQNQASPLHDLRSVRTNYRRAVRDCQAHFNAFCSHFAYKTSETGGTLPGFSAFRLLREARFERVPNSSDGCTPPLAVLGVAVDQLVVP